ncbi:hypothetical protein Mycsm_04363 [Mycobacterium sp. JS623]|nr:hypothetical protein Mycsm_04363 [Mycobacterium sp. JS623]
MIGRLPPIECLSGRAMNVQGDIWIRPCPGPTLNFFKGMPSG